MKLVNDRYCIGNVALIDLCSRFGTPLYVYDANKIESQYKRLTSSFSGIKFKVKYACKANSNLSLMRFLRSLGCELDTVSLNEVKLGLYAGFTPDEILYTPNCVSVAEIMQAVELGVRINIDSITMLEHFGHIYGSKVPVCVRINPHLVAGGNSHIQTGHIDSKFGISIHQMRHLLRVISAHHLKIEGLHMHTGSDILDPDAFLSGLDILFNHAVDFPDLKYLDFGSGFKVAYKDGDITTPVETLGPKVVERFNNFCNEYGRELELWCEPGKFLVSESGYLLVQVNLVKQTVSTVFAGVNSGMNHLIRPMMYDAYHHVVNISNQDGNPRVYSVVGYICETDTFGWDRMLNEVREDDILALQNAGAYGFSMSSNYNSRLKPAEIMVYNDEVHLIRERQNFDDLLKNQPEIEFQTQETEK